MPTTFVGWVGKDVYKRQQQPPQAAQEQKPPVQPQEVRPAFTPQEQKMIEDFAAKIDVTDTNLVFSYGASAQQQIASFSDSALKNVQTKDLGEVGDMIGSLVTELKGFTVDEEESEMCIRDSRLGAVGPAGPAVDAGGGGHHQLGLGGQPLRVVAPLAAQGAALHEHRGAHPGPVEHGEFLDIEYHPGH